MASTPMTDPYAAYGGSTVQSGGADPYAAYGGKVATAPPASDTRSLYQKAKDNFNANTQGSKPGDGAVKGFVENIGQYGGNVVRSTVNMLAHPLDQAHSEVDTVRSAVSHPLDAAQRALDQTHAEVDAARANPSKFVANVIGTIGTGAILGELASPAIAAATRIIPRIPGAVSEAKTAFTDATYPKNLSLTPEEVTAQKVVRSLQPDPAAVPNVKSASPEIPDALAYAQREGIPQNGKLDTAKALQGRADEIQAHYDDNILKPNKTQVQTVPGNYDGATVGDSKATLGQINDRVDVINRELKSNFRKKLSSQTTEANASDADLLSEKGQLTTILHDKLGELTGISPEDIAAMRQRAGKLRSLAQEVADSANKDTLAAGKREVSGGTFSIRNPIEGLQDKVGGGQEVIGNRSWKQTLDSIQPAEKPLAQPNAPGPNVATTPEAAQAEFLRSQQLEQAAQQAAAGRSQAVQSYRGEQAANNQAAARIEATRLSETEQAAQDAAVGRSSQASAARLQTREASNSELWSSQGYTKVLKHLENDPSSGISRADLVKDRFTPQVKSLLVRASGLTPGSPAMRSIIQQIKNKLGPAE